MAFSCHKGSGSQSGDALEHRIPERYRSQLVRVSRSMARAETLFEKALGCWLPVMAFVALGYEHCIANMFFIPLGMMEGADITVMQSITANFIPSTLGNIAGGALLVGALNGYIHNIGKK